MRTEIPTPDRRTGPAVDAEGLQALDCETRRKAQTLLKRMAYLFEKSDGSDGNGAGYKRAEYCALHWALKELGIIADDDRTFPRPPRGAYRVQGGAQRESHDRQPR